MISFKRTTNTSSSRYTSISTAASASSPTDDMVVRTLSVTRDGRKTKPVTERYYRAMVSASTVPWDMHTEYTECELVGKGSYGDVCRAVSQDAASSAVAIKRVDILEDDLDSDWENGLRLLREVHFLRTLNHPNLAKLSDLFPNKDYHDNPRIDCLKTIYIVSEYCSSGSLNGYAVSNFSEILSIHRQILSALEYMHNHNILHRDIKRENIFIRKNASSRRVHVTVGDFGLSRTRINHMTSEVVTKPYRCPSLILGETQYGPEIDVYATGIVLAEMLFGKLNSTLLPNRKMGPKNFLKYQFALWRYEGVETTTVSCPFGNRLIALANQMHVDLDNIVNSPISLDYDDQVVQEWSRMVWGKIKAVDGIDYATISMLRSMICIDPKQRPSISSLLPKSSLSSKQTTSSCIHCEFFDSEISVLETDAMRAFAVKDKMAQFIQQSSMPTMSADGKQQQQRFSLRLLSRKRSIGQI
jgi:serine/threonine protein kinase